MKKILFVFSAILLLGCEKDLIEPINSVVVPESLKISELIGIKVESTIVSDEVEMNVKLPYTGVYRTKVKDISNEFVSQEKIKAEEGDNLLKVYVSSLPNDGYTLQLTDDNHKILGVTNIIVSN
jgi:hypothetical protein